MSSVVNEILPEALGNAFRGLPIQKIYELRLRAGKPVAVVLAGRSFYLGQSGELTQSVTDAIAVSKSDLETLIHRAADYSLYAVNDQLKNGFITVRGGVRIGIVGEVVYGTNGEVKTIKNIQGLNIRIPHEVRGCSYRILPYIFGNFGAYKTLIISPPGAGKTTMLRDLARNLFEKYHLPNVLILDERGEIAANYMGENQLDVGMADVLTGCDKAFGFSCGIRSMAPDVIITDEVAGESDVAMIREATRSGVCVFASVHARNIDELRAKPLFKSIIEDQIFDRYVVLSTKDTAGEVVGVFDRNLKPIIL